MVGVANGEALTVIEVPNGLEGLTVGKKWPWPKDPPNRLSTGEQVELGVNKHPRSHRIAQSAV